MKIKMFAIFAALAISSFGQLIINSAPDSAFVTSIKNDNAFINGTIQNIGSFPVSFNLGANTYTNVGALPFGTFKAGSDSSGQYSLKVSYLAEFSDWENKIGVGNSGVTQHNLYSTYNTNNLTHTITAGSVTNVDFFNYNVQGDLISWQNDPSHFTFYKGQDNTYFGIFDDLGRPTHDGDYNDGAIYIQPIYVPFQDIPVDPQPVPEPSTYALLGGIMLLALALYKRLR